MRRLSRRTVLKGVGGALALPMIGRAAFAQDLPKSIRVGSYGGIFDKAMDIFSREFTKRTGVEVEIVVGNSVQWINQLTATPDNPPLEIMSSPVSVMLDAGRKGLFEKPTSAVLTNLADIPAKFVDMAEGNGVVWDYGAIGLAYHKGRVPNPPASLAELIEGAAAGKWRVSLLGISNPGVYMLTIWYLNVTLGGKMDDISPAIEAVKKMGDNVLFYNSYPDFLTQLETGEADIGIFPDGRAFAHQDAGADWIDYYNPSEGGVFGGQVILKPAKAHPVAWKYIDVMLDPAKQSEFSDFMGGYGVTNSKVVYTPRSQKRVSPWQNLQIPPDEAIAAAIPAWRERWNREVGR